MECFNNCLCWGGWVDGWVCICIVKYQLQEHKHLHNTFVVLFSVYTSFHHLSLNSNINGNSFSYCVFLHVRPKEAGEGHHS